LRGVEGIFQLEMAHEVAPRNHLWPARVFENREINFSDGTYLGHTRDGRRHGRGALTFNNEESYVGDWDCDKYHGVGVYQWRNGSYKGDWRYNLFHGKGRLTHGGSTFVGEFKEGEMDGVFSVKFSNGDSFDGDYRCGRMEGIGTYGWSNGDTYRGEYYKGERSGKGVYTWKNGTKYEGRFEGGKRHGRGKLTSVEGAVYKGSWKMDRLHDIGVESNSAGQVLYVYGDGTLQWVQKYVHDWTTQDLCRWLERKDLQEAIPAVVKHKIRSRCSTLTRCRGCHIADLDIKSLGIGVIGVEKDFQKEISIVLLGEELFC
jgi:hypothetical protein